MDYYINIYFVHICSINAILQAFISHHLFTLSDLKAKIRIQKELDR